MNRTPPSSNRNGADPSGRGPSGRGPQSNERHRPVQPDPRRPARGVPQPRSSTPTLARRVLPVVAIGGAAGALIMALDHPGGTRTASAAALGAATSDSVVVDDSSNKQIAPADSTVAVSTTVPAAPRVIRSTAPSSSRPSSAPSSSTPTTVTAAGLSSSGSCVSYKGQTEYNRFGAVEVQASVSSSGKICSVKVIQLPGDRHSRRINDYAVPLLNKQAMRAQSADIRGVSGATYTTIGYIDSLQSIIDAATR